MGNSKWPKKFLAKPQDVTLFGKIQAHVTSGCEEPESFLEKRTNL